MDDSSGSVNNVTMRPKKLFKSTSSEYEQNLSLHSVDSELHMRSLGYLDLSTGPDQDVVDNLKQQTLFLTDKLQIANNEIDNLLLEKHQLENVIAQQNQQIATLKEICRSPKHNLRSNVKSNRRMSRMLLADRSRFSTPDTYNQKEDLDSSSQSLSLKCCTDLQKNVSLNSTTNKPYTSERLNATYCVNGSDDDKTDANSLEENMPEQMHPSITQNSIYIIGGRQCLGLSSKLLDTGIGHNFTAFVKPEATTEEILKTCCIIKDKTDTIILSVGEHDKNPTRVMTELSAILKSLSGRHVYVLSVKQNRYLNEKLLNYSMKNVCAQYPNCNFIDLTKKLLNDDNEDKLIGTLFNLLNMSREQSGKKKMYVDRRRNILKKCVKMSQPMKSINCDANTSNSVMYRCLRNVHVQPEPYIKGTDGNISADNKSAAPRRGTIPYYFYPEKECIAVSANGSDVPSVPQNHKKGTIPFYFNKTTKHSNGNQSQTFFRS